MKESASYADLDPYEFGDIDPSLLFFGEDSNQSSQATAEIVSDTQSSENSDVIFEEVISYGQWLSQFDESDISTHDGSPDKPGDRPAAFAWADQAATTVSANLANISAESLSAVGSTLGSLLSVIGSCGPLCLHAAGALAQSGASLGGVTSLGGVGLPGFSIDGSGKYTLSGDINALSSATGLSSRDLMSGKYSSDEIMERYFKFFGLFSGFNLVGGFIHLLFDAFTPQVRG